VLYHCVEVGKSVHGIGETGSDGRLHGVPPFPSPVTSDRIAERTWGGSPGHPSMTRFKSGSEGNNSEGVVQTPCKPAAARATNARVV
jgi:hypothetical protein